MSVQQTSRTNHYPSHQFQNERPNELTMGSTPEEHTLRQPRRMVDILNVPFEDFFQENPPLLNEDLIDQATENYRRMPRQERGRFRFRQIVLHSLYLMKNVGEMISKQSNTEAIQLQEKQPVALTVFEEQSSSPDNALMLNEMLGIIEEQNSAVQEEFAITLKQSQNTILNLQNAQQALLLENAQLRAQVTVMASQINQMNAAHETDTQSVQERNKTLEEALGEKTAEAKLLTYDVKRLEKTVEIHNTAFSQIISLRSQSSMWYNWIGAIDNILNEKDHKLDEEKPWHLRKWKKEGEGCCIQ